MARAGVETRGARDVALEVLVAVEEEAAYANLALAGALRRTALDRRERALATELTYGTLRWRGRIDWMIDRLAARPLASMQVVVRNALRLGFYQLFWLKGIPGPVAVAETVELVKRHGQARAAGFVNAVCRAALRTQDWAWPDPQREPILALAVRYSHPAWLVERWVRHLGAAEAEALLAANNEAAPLVLRVNVLKAEPTALAQELQSAGAEVRPGQLAPAALVLAQAPAVTDLPAFRAGLLYVQDEAAQLVAHIAAPEPGSTVIDLCAGPGGKSTHLAELMGDQGRVLALELHPRRADLVRETAHRLGLRSVAVQVGDGRQPPVAWRGTGQRVVLDVPCSGTGVLRRRPDLRWRKELADLGALTQLQAELLAAAADLVSPGGYLIYSACSLEPEEGPHQLEAFLQKDQRFAPAPLAEVLPAPARERLARDWGQAAWAFLYPHRHGCDGFFIGRLRRQA